MKKCFTCHQYRPFSDFSKDRQKKDGYRSNCNICRGKYRAYIYKNDPVSREKDKARAAKYRAEHPGYNAESMARCYRRRKEIAFERAKRWTKENPHKRTEIQNRARANKLKATPKWADIKLIQEYYETASGLSMLLGEWYHVDHIVPLRGKFVCGLHCQFNLQILPASENIRKGNRFVIEPITY